MSRQIDYYLAPNSPWTCLGHDRLVDMAQRHQCTVKVLPINLGAIFPVTGGLPLPKRAPARQAYRLVELRRFAESLDLPIHIEPRFFPVDATRASLLIVATDQRLGSHASLNLAGRLMKAVWMQERNIADEATLMEVLQEAGLPADLLQASQQAVTQQALDDNTRQALDAGVFGAPSYVVQGELFWGQDRLDLLARKIAQGT